MAEYWALRVHEALNHSRRATTSEARKVHLRAAEHYDAMQKLCALHEGKIAALPPAQY